MLTRKIKKSHLLQVLISAATKADLQAFIKNSALLKTSAEIKIMKFQKYVPFTKWS